MPLFGRLSNSLNITKNYIPPPSGQQLFTVTGNTNFVVPSSVTSICAVCIGGGGAGWQTTGTGTGVAILRNLLPQPRVFLLTGRI